MPPLTTPAATSGAKASASLGAQMTDEAIAGTPPASDAPQEP